MLTQVELAVATGLGLTQLRKYLKKAVDYLLEHRSKIADYSEVIVQEVNGKPQYHPIVLKEIEVRIKDVRDTRYERSVRSRRRNRGAKEAA